MKSIHLLSNAHIDPVWQWSIEEGISSALATFRSAAMLLEKNKDFVFNHNEALLYRFTEEYEPSLFKRIQKLVAEGVWQIVGGFELQPDCVMIGGESFIRQIMHGKAYFKEKFGVEPSVAMNVDSFGHSRGMVQILVDAGYKAYLYLRPEAGPKDFIWEGFDGSKLLAHRFQKGYNSSLGNARKELEQWIAARSESLEEVELFPWGVGNHGGGPSQKDISDLNALIDSLDYDGELSIRHSTPEQYFEGLNASKHKLPRISESLYSSNVGCYTSVMELKHLHRNLEGMLLRAEKAISMAALYTGEGFSPEMLNEAWRALMLLQFHDVLPGSLTRPAMEKMMHLGGFGLELVRKVTEKAFFRLAEEIKGANEHEIPIIVLNPHPYPVKRVLECEIMLPDQNRGINAFTDVLVHHKGKAVASQVIKEDSTIPIDWRKKVAFEADLEPFSMARFDCALLPSVLPKKPAVFETFDNGELFVRFSLDSGLIDEMRINHTPIARSGFGAISIFRDNDDPWHMESNKIGTFEKIMPIKPGTSPKVTEDGALFTQVEVQFEENGCEAVVSYRFPKHGARVSMDVLLRNIKSGRMYRLCFPVASRKARLMGESMFGLEEKFYDGTENVSQRFDLLEWENASFAVINNCVYGGCVVDGALYKSLLRSPVYCAHPIDDRPLLDEHRTYDRTGMGEYQYQFVLQMSLGGYRMETVREAQLMHEPPIVVQHFSPGTEQNKISGMISVSGAVAVSAVKLAEDGRGLIIRLYEPTGNGSAFSIQCMETQINDVLSPFESRTYRFHDNHLTTCDCLERAR